MDSFKELLKKFISVIPFKKLSANQAFDLAADAVMIIFVLLALREDLGPRQDLLKSMMIMYVLGFITWSAMANR